MQIIALAALATAATLVHASPLAATSATLSSPFQLHFIVGGASSNDTAALFSAVVTEDASSGTYVIAGRDPSEFNSTPAYFRGNRARHLALLFDMANVTAATSAADDVDATKLKLWGATVPDIGDVDDVADSVTVSADGAQHQWSVDDETGQLAHTLYAADNEFLSCLVELNGAGAYVLKFGEESETGQLPANCTPTEIYQS